ncbi:MAG: hypothetical protein ACFE95_15715 [Candidatus Hodarchaeota archaeon]
MDIDIIIQEYGAICRKEKVQGDINYLETTRKLAQEQFDSGKPEEHLAEISLEECLLEPRMNLPADYSTYIHPAHLVKMRKELVESYHSR